MDPVERSRQLKHEADYLLSEIGLNKIIQPFGKVTATGSYFLDVMVYPDIDLYIPLLPLDQIFSVGAQLVASPLITQILIKKSDDPRLPGGIYIKPTINYGSWQRPWKIDIWSIDQVIVDDNLCEMDHFRQSMTPEQRSMIINYKYRIINREHRTPMLSGYYIYKAVIDEGMTDFEDINLYLLSHNIQIDV